MSYNRLIIWPTITAVSIGVGGLMAYSGSGDTLVSGAQFQAVLTWLAAAILAVVAWRTLRHRSPVALLLVYGFLGFGILSAVLYRPTTVELTGSRALVAHIAQQTQSFRYLLIFVAASFAIWCAGLLVSILFPSRQEHGLSVISLRIPHVALALAVIPLLAYIYGIGTHTLLHAERYLEHTGSHVGLSVGQTLGPVAVLICGYFAFHQNQSIATRAFALILALAYESLYLAIATRAFALWLPLMIIGGMFTGTWSTQRLRVSLLAAGIGAIILVQVPVSLRSLPNHGLIPGSKYLFTQPSLVFGTHGPINNVLFGAPLTFYVANDAPAISTGALLTSISPMPSALNNWNQIANRLRVNFSTPYSALGELLNHGWFIFIIFMALLGAGFTLIERIASSQMDLVAGLGKIVVLGSASLFLVQSTEYNLRSACRLVYYTFIIVVAMRIIFATSRGKQASLALGRSHDGLIGSVSAQRY